MATGSSSKFPRVFKYYDVPTEVPQGDFKAKCRYCPKEITGSCKATTNWWKHLVKITIYLTLGNAY